jgi:hypothetical protein
VSASEYKIVLNSAALTCRDLWGLNLKNKRRLVMKVDTRGSLVAMVLLIALISFAPRANAGQCSLSGTAGKYGFTLSGTVVLPTGPVLIAAVGRVSLDGAGNANGTEARSVGGGFADETFTGTYAVNADCTGTANIQFFESGQLVRTSILSLVFDNNQREIRMVQKSLQLPGGAFLPVVVVVEARKMFSEED